MFYMVLIEAILSCLSFVSGLRWRPRLLLSGTFTEVEQRRPRLVLGWVTVGKTERCEPVSVCRRGP